MRTPCSSRAVIVAAALLLAAAGCRNTGSVAGSSGPSPAQGGELRMPLTSDPQHLTPLHAETVDELTVVRELFSGLTDVDPATGDIVPSIARSWSASDDLRAFTFRLRGDVRFSDGTPVTASTFVDDWNVICRTGGSAAPLLELVEGGAGCGRPGWIGPLSGVAATGPTQLRVRLEKPFADLPAVVASPTTWAFPAAASSDPSFDTAPVGSGPFVLASRTAGRRLALERSPTAVHPPLLDGIEFTLLPKADGELAALRFYRRGRFDVAEVPPQQAQVSMTDPTLSSQLLVAPLAAETVVALRPSPRLGLQQRRALAFATDGPTAAASVTGGVSTVADGLVPEGMAGYIPDVSPYTSDPGAARRKLAGHPLRTLRLASVADGSLTGLAPLGRIGATLAQGYRAVGVTVKPAPARTADAVVLRVDAPYPSPDALLSALAPAGDDDALAEARRTADPSQRASAYERASSRILADATVIPVTFDARVFVVSPHVNRFMLDPLGLPHLELCWLTGGGTSAP